MDLLTGILNSNAAIKTPDAFGSFSRGQKNQQDIYKAELEKYKTQSDINAKQIENEKARYAQDQEYRMKQAIQESIKENGQLDVDILPRKAAEYGVAREGIDYMIKTLPAQFESIKKTALERKIAEKIQPGITQTQPKTKVEQKSNLSPAVPVTEKEQAQPKTMWGVAATGDVATSAGSLKKFTAKDYDELSEEKKKDLVRGLELRGYTFTSANKGPEAAKYVQEVIEKDWKAKEAEAYKGNPEQIGGQIIALEGYKDKAGDDTVAELFKTGIADRTTKLGNKSTELGMVATKQGIIEKEQKQEVVRQLKSEGYNATVDNAAEIIKLKGQQETIDKNIKHLEDLKERVKAGRMDPDVFNSELKNIMAAIQSAENIGTEAQRESLFKTLRADPSLAATLESVDGWKDGIVAIGKLLTTKQKQPEALQILDILLTNIKNSGIVAGGLEAYKTKEKPKTNKTNTPREKTSETPKIGDKNKEGKTWTGKRWL